MIEIDGSFGEGGGQILRTSVSLATIFGEPLRIYNIRAKRSNPGLRPQHLTAVTALAKICNARLENARIGSREILFNPGAVKGGLYEFDVGTAGSITLVLQTLIPPLLVADRESKIRIKGGTDVKWAPQISYFTEVFLEMLKRMGLSVSAQIISRGYYPEGGGEVILEIEPSKPSGLSLLEKRGKPDFGGIAHSQNMPDHLTDRMTETAAKYLSIDISKIRKDVRRGRSRGAGIVLWCRYDNTILGSDKLLEDRQSAEDLAKSCCESLLKEVNSEATVDINMSDQIMIYGALASELEYIARDLTEHSRTNAEVMKAFGINISIEKFKNSYRFCVRR